MKNYKNCWTVYCHTTPSGKRYIGITSQKPEKRWSNGRGYNKKLPFGQAIEKYKWENIKHEILYTNLDEDDAKRIEKEYIEKYRTYIYFKDCNGYNMTLGGDGTVGWEPTDETKNRISESKKGKHPTDETKRRMSDSRKGIPPGNKGKHHTDETKRRMSDSRKGRTSPNKGKHFTEEHKRKIGESNKGKHCKPHSEEEKKRISESLKGKTPWNKDKTGVQVAHNKGKHLVMIDGKRHYE